MLFFVLDIAYDFCVNLQKLAAVRAEPVKRTALDKAFYRAGVHIFAVETVAKIIQRLIRLVSALGDYLLDKLPAEVLYGEQSVADIAAVYGKAEPAFVDSGRQNADTEALALGDINGELILIVEHAREQSRHIFLWIVAFEPRGFV